MNKNGYLRPISAKTFIFSRLVGGGGGKAKKKSENFRAKLYILGASSKWSSSSSSEGFVSRVALTREHSP